MMKLLSHPFSPYGRKVKLAMAMKGVKDNVEVVMVDTNILANPEITIANPLSKIPALIVRPGEAIFDSAVICEYLDSLAPSPVLFPKGADRWKTLTLGALADGMLDAALLLVYEKRFRPEEKWHEPWLERQRSKINLSLDHLEKAPPAWDAGGPDYGHLTLAAALGYLDFRHDGTWRGGHPRLVAWLDAFAKAVPAFEETRPKQA